MWRSAAVLALLVVAARAQFPFTDQPLQESIHSNKVFFNITNLKDLAGVWRGVNIIYHAYINAGFLYDGVSPFNITCEQAQSGGWDYDYYTINPRGLTIEIFEEPDENGLIGYMSEAEYADIKRHGIVEYNAEEHTVVLESGACRKWRPYLDWELGKTMMLRNTRLYYYPDESGITSYNELEGCINADVDHPQCIEGTFDIDGGTHTGVAFDSPSFFECLAGPCLDLPFTLDSFVQTQGYVPAWAMDPDSTATDGK